MLKYLPGIKWVGKLSLEDADLLAEYGGKSSSILEFGAGGSTLILSQVTANTFISIEEDPDWLILTKERLSHLGTRSKVNMYLYTDPYKVPEVDLMFIDGTYKNRLPFARKYWSNLKDGGYLLFHDTSREKYLADALTLVNEKFDEIEFATVNIPASNGRTSNVTLIKKGKRPPYNWKSHEGKPPWTYSEDRTVDKFKMWEYVPGTGDK